MGGGLLLLGVIELVTHLDEPVALLFWLPTLWGGAALVLAGVFRKSTTPLVSTFLVLGGAALGIVPSAWTVLMPVLCLTLLILVIRQATVDTAASTD